MRYNFLHHLPFCSREKENKKKRQPAVIITTTLLILFITLNDTYNTTSTTISKFHGSGYFRASS
jgi:hypothetical protein